VLRRRRHVFDDVVVEGGGAAVTGTETTETTVTKTETKTEEVKPRGFYAGGGIGGSFFEGPGNHSRIFNRSTLDTNFDGQPDAFTSNKIDDENNFMWSLFFGYRMADWLGAEVGWTDLGGFKSYDTGPDFVGDTNHTNKVSPSVDGIEARLKAWVPLGTDIVSGIGGLGIFIFQSHGAKKCLGPDTSACTKGPGHFDRVPPALDPREDSGQAFTISAGLQFRVTDNVLIRTEYAHFFSVLDQGVDMVTANVVFGFYDLFGQGKGGNEFGGITVE